MSLIVNMKGRTVKLITFICIYNNSYALEIFFVFFCSEEMQTHLEKVVIWFYEIFKDFK